MYTIERRTSPRFIDVLNACIMPQLCLGSLSTNWKWSAEMSTMRSGGQCGLGEMIERYAVGTIAYRGGLGAFVLGARLQATVRVLALLQSLTATAWREVGVRYIAADTERVDRVKSVIKEKESKITKRIDWISAD